MKNAMIGSIFALLSAASVAQADAVLKINYLQQDLVFSQDFILAGALGCPKETKSFLDQKGVIATGEFTVLKNDAQGNPTDVQVQLVKMDSFFIPTHQTGTLTMKLALSNTGNLTVTATSCQYEVGK
jgi:hypothetical protein